MCVRCILIKVLEREASVDEFEDAIRELIREEIHKRFAGFENKKDKE